MFVLVYVSNDYFLYLKQNDKYKLLIHHVLTFTLIKDRGVTGKRAMKKLVEYNGSPFKINQNMIRKKILRLVTK